MYRCIAINKSEIFCRVKINNFSDVFVIKSYLPLFFIMLVVDIFRVTHCILIIVDQFYQLGQNNYHEFFRVMNTLMNFIFLY